MPVATRRPPLTGAIVALGLLLLAFGVGFVAGHDPQRDTVSFRLEAPSGRPSETFHPGVVSNVDDAAIEISTAAGIQRFELQPSTPIEDLSPLGTSPDIAAGAPVNVGGERTDNGYVLTGVVVIETDE